MKISTQILFGCSIVVLFFTPVHYYVKHKNDRMPIPSYVPQTTPQAEEEEEEPQQIVPEPTPPLPLESPKVEFKPPKDSAQPPTKKREKKPNRRIPTQEQIDDFDLDTGRAVLV